MKIDQKEPIPQKCLPILEETVAGLPAPTWLSDGRRNRSLKRLQKNMSETLRLLREGETVRWGGVCALRQDFLEKRETFYSQEECELIDRQLEEARQRIERVLAGETVRPETKEVQVDSDRKLVYVSAAMDKVVSLAARLANEEVAVILLGETGVGKDLVAKMLHTQSERAEHPFKAVNCAALSPALLESELFGHAKGAFTGAYRKHDGLLKTVGQGTLFLDEIADMDPRLQAKLLRTLQGAGFRPVGDSNGEQKFEGRIVAATNRNLTEAVRSGSFRLDLFFRIAQFQLNVPPLRQRPEDIDPLIDSFLKELEGEVSITQQARKKLREHSFPGNVRELEAVLKKAHILATLNNQENPVIGDEHIEFYDLPDPESFQPVGEKLSPEMLSTHLEALETRLRTLEALLQNQREIG